MSVKFMNSNSEYPFLHLLSIIVSNYNEHYTQKAEEFLNKMGLSGYIIVSGYSPDELPELKEICSLACSIGAGRFGAILVNKNLLENSALRELTEFAIAHEVAHIAKSHIIVSLITKRLFETYYKRTKARIENIAKARNLVDFVANIFAAIISAAIAGVLLNVDKETIKTQELEADTIAIQLAGCKSAIAFAKFLEALRSQGILVSHEAVLGFPALTIDERIKNICRHCP